MPFKSEKQRRFLWAAHPDIAKRWAHEYPNQKKLPMYAHDKKDSDEKTSAITALNAAISRVVNFEKTVTNSAPQEETKTANSGLEYVKIPHSDKPTYAGQEHAELGEKKDDTQEFGEEGQKPGSDSVESIFGKLAAVLAKPLREMMEAQQAAQEGRDPRFVPQNMNIRRVSIPSPAIPLPMGMAPPAQQAPAQQPSNAQSNSPVGGGSNPQHNPINAFGPLGAKGQLNGNAAFGVKNSPDSLKTAHASPSILSANQEKTAIDVVQGGLPARVLSSTIGHIPVLPQSLLISPRMHQNSSNWQGAGNSIFARDINPNDQRAQRFNTLAKDMARVRPQELSGTRVYLGGPRFFEEMGRGYTNPRTSILGKALSTLTTPLNYGMSSLTRGDAYNPATDSIYSYSNSPAIFSHELGHAIDFNKAPIAKTFLGRQWQGLKRDVGGIAGRMGPLVINNEAAANRKSFQALQEAYKNNPGKLQPLLQERQRVLPAAMGTYVGGATYGTAAGLNRAAKRLPAYLPKLAPHLGAIARATEWAGKGGPRTALVLGGLGAGKLYGLVQAARNKQAASGGAWTRAEGKNPEGGLNAKGRASLKAQGHDIKAPVTESNPTGERAGRRKSFCSRMCGMKRVNTGAKAKSDPDSRINKSLRKWNCKCGSAMDLLVITGLEKAAVLDVIGHALQPVMRGLTVAKPTPTMFQRATQMVTGRAPATPLGTKLKELAMNRVVKPGVMALGMLGAGHDVANHMIQPPTLQHVTSMVNGVVQPSRTLVNGVRVLQDGAPTALSAAQKAHLMPVGYKKPMWDILPGITSRGPGFNPAQAAQQFAQSAR